MKKSNINKSQNYITGYKINDKVNNAFKFFTDISSFKKTMFLSLLFVFLFYLPFTFITLFLNKVVFFQLDYVYQFSTIVFDFRNRLMDLNFSTWDFKNSIGYDYFANFYYIPLDITLLPYFLFPFLAYSKLMWLSFIFKVMLGTAAFCYLLKLYKMNHKTILLVSVLYGTADLFFAQNVFPSYTGLTFYIPLVLISIELMFQKNNFLVFSLVIFQIFLFNSYWAWGLSLFMAFALLVRTIYHFFTFKNLNNLDPYIKSCLFIGKSILYYLLGLGIAAFFFLPTLGIMQNEPRMEMSQTGIFNIILSIFKTYKLEFGDMVYYKEFFKMLVPNLYMYSGFFHDIKADYWLTTNHVIIYSSILASFSLFFLILYPTFLASEKLTKEQLKTFITLKVVTFIATMMVLFPFTAYLFSMNSGPYLRWLIFYGVLLVIDFAFIYQYKLFNNILFASFLVISIGYLIFSIQYNRNFVAKYKETHNNKGPNIFTGIDENVAYTMIIAFIVILFLVIFLDKYMQASITLLIERAVAIGLIFSVCVSPHFTRGVRHADLYPSEINKMMKKVELEDYYTMTEYLFYDDNSSVETMQDMTYLFDFPVYNNFNIFHSLINPYFTFHSSNDNHKRYYRSLDIPYLYYYYMDPSLFILSDSKENPINNGMYDPDSELVGYKDIDELNSFLSIYQKKPQFSIGNGFTTYYNLENRNEFDYLWLESLYVNNRDDRNQALIKYLEDNDFKEEDAVKNSFIHYLRFNLSDATEYDMKYYPGDFNEFPINISKADTDAVIIGTVSKKVFSIDNDGNVKRCFNRFCLVPDSGLKSIVIDKEYPTFYTVDKEYLNEKTEQILKYSTYDVKINGNHISSKVDNDQPIIMTYKVGYAKGWNVYVDNQKVKTFPSYNGQISFIINDVGTHKIELNYETPNLKKGIYISTASIVIFGSLTYLKIRKRGKRCINS
ncbi:YfhO family protein [Mycoplasmatota bacterium]|nr:YfhO family protein [Mycoplasmatota bacterium]